MRCENLLLLLLASTPAVGAPRQYASPQDIDALPSKPSDLRSTYGADPLQFGELRLPKGKGPFPVAIVVHGGCWLSAFATLKNTAAIADALRDAGVATWNVEYRRIDNEGGGWPGTFQDVAAAADHLRVLAEKHPLDLKRTVAVGHSAGGHLALWLAARDRIPKQAVLYRENPLRLIGAVDLGGPADMKDFANDDDTICGGPVVDDLFGGTPSAVPDHYAQGSPASMLPLGVPHLLIVGADDPVVPERARAAYARKAGKELTVFVIPAASHFEPIHPKSKAWDTVRKQVLRLVSNH